MSQVIRVPTDIYSRLEQHAKGFDTPANVIEKLLNHYEGVEQSPAIMQPDNNSINSRDTTKYYFNNHKYGKGRLVLAVVTNYVSDHPDINIDELRAVFPKNLQGSIGVFNELEFVKNKYADKGHKRHFVKPNETVQIGDCSVAVCTEWGAGNIEMFVEQTEALGYTVTPTNG